jgi:hypothetical protein
MEGVIYLAGRTEIYPGGADRTPPAVHSCYKPNGMVTAACSCVVGPESFARGLPEDGDGPDFSPSKKARPGMVVHTRFPSYVPHANVQIKITKLFKRPAF